MMIKKFILKSLFKIKILYANYLCRNYLQNISIIEFTQKYFIQERGDFPYS